MEPVLRALPRGAAAVAARVAPKRGAKRQIEPVPTTPSGVSVGMSCMAKSPTARSGGWYAATVVQVDAVGLRLVFVDGETAVVDRAAVRLWHRAPANLVVCDPTLAFLSRRAPVFSPRVSLDDERNRSKKTHRRHSIYISAPALYATTRPASATHTNSFFAPSNKDPCVAGANRRASIPARSDGERDASRRQRPIELTWHKRRKTAKGGKRHVESANAQSANRAVEQICMFSGDSLKRWPSAKRAAEGVSWVPDSCDIVLCCRGSAPQAGGYRWKFADPRPKIDSADVDELLSVDAKCVILKVNPKKKPSKSHDLYEGYKTANSLKEMLSKGGRRGDIAYDIAHGWITLLDPELARRFNVLIPDANQPGPKQPAGAGAPKKKGTAPPLSTAGP